MRPEPGPELGLPIAVRRGKVGGTMKPSEQDCLSPRSGSTMLAVIALLSAICFAVLVVFQVLEYQTYSSLLP